MRLILCSSPTVPGTSLWTTLPPHDCGETGPTVSDALLEICDDCAMRSCKVVRDRTTLPSDSNVKQAGVPILPPSERIIVHRPLVRVTK
jgi:hypothetical protein